MESGSQLRMSGAHCSSPRIATVLNMSCKFDWDIYLMLLEIILPSGKDFKNSSTQVQESWIRLEFWSRLAVTDDFTCHSEEKHILKGAFSLSVTSGGIIAW